MKSEYYPIERDVAVVPKRKKRRSNIKYPFDSMKIGDSFLVPSEDSHRSVSIAASNYGKAYGEVFVTRTVEDGVRVWRIA